MIGNYGTSPSGPSTTLQLTHHLWLRSGTSAQRTWASSVFGTFPANLRYTCGRYQDRMRLADLWLTGRDCLVTNREKAGDSRLFCNWLKGSVWTSECPWAQGCEASVGSTPSHSMANSLCPASLFAPVTLDKSPCLSEIPVSPRELGNCHRMSVTGSELSVPFRLNSVWSHRAGPGWFPPHAHRQHRSHVFKFVWSQVGCICFLWLLSQAKECLITLFSH